MSAIARGRVEGTGFAAAGGGGGGGGGGGIGAAVGGIEGTVAASYGLSPEDSELMAKWNALQLTQESVNIEDVRFMMTSKLAFSIALFKNATAQGQERHALRTVNGTVCMKKGGEWVPLSEIRNMLEYDPTQDKLVAKTNREIVWSYLSPNGLVPFDRYKYDALPAIEELSPVEYEAILKQAQSFWWNEQPEVDPGVEKKCVLQIVTTNRLHSEDWATENLMRAYPEHATFRVIAPDGKVYSFGFQMEKEEENSIFKDRSFPYPLTFLKTTETRITSPDYEEARPYRLKRVTSIAMTQARMDSILAFVAEQNKKGITFNFIRQNCATLGGILLEKAGITARPERFTLGQGLATLLPEWHKIPYIGKPLASVMNAINYVSQKVFGGFKKYTPQVIQDVVTFIPRKIATLISNTFLVTIGGRLSSEHQQKVRARDLSDDDFDDERTFTCFTRLINSIADMFREDISDIDAHTNLIEWQIKQASTRTHRSDGTVRLVL